VSGGHTYTTIITRPGEPTRISVSFHLDASAWIAVAGTGTDTPHLSIGHGGATVRIGPRTGEVTAEDAKIARELADQAATYAAQIERLAARNPADGTSAA
jgi:hypothetical protein